MESKTRHHHINFPTYVGVTPLLHYVFIQQKQPTVTRFGNYSWLTVPVGRYALIGWETNAGLPAQIGKTSGYIAAKKQVIYICVSEFFSRWPYGCHTKLDEKHVFTYFSSDFLFWPIMFLEFCNDGVERTASTFYNSSPPNTLSFYALSTQLDEDNCDMESWDTKRILLNK